MNEDSLQLARLIKDRAIAIVATVQVFVALAIVALSQDVIGLVTGVALGLVGWYLFSKSKSPSDIIPELKEGKA